MKTVFAFFEIYWIEDHYRAERLIDLYDNEETPKMLALKECREWAKEELTDKYHWKMYQELDKTVPAVDATEYRAISDKKPVFNQKWHGDKELVAAHTARKDAWKAEYNIASEKFRVLVEERNELIKSMIEPKEFTVEEIDAYYAEALKSERTSNPQFEIRKMEIKS